MTRGFCSGGTRHPEARFALGKAAYRSSWISSPPNAAAETNISPSIRQARGPPSARGWRWRQAQRSAARASRRRAPERLSAFPRKSAIVGQFRLSWQLAFIRIPLRPSIYFANAGTQRQTLRRRALGPRFRGATKTAHYVERHAGRSHTEVSWKTAPPRSSPGSALVKRIFKFPTSKAWLGHTPSTMTTRGCSPSKAQGMDDDAALAVAEAHPVAVGKTQIGEPQGVDKSRRAALEGDAR